MKKALVAVAILAALGTAHAQFKIGGKLAYDIKRADNSSTTMSPMDTSNINFTATESIGNGITVKAYAEIQPGGNGTATEGNDLYIDVATRVGSVKVGQVESANGIIGLGLGDAPFKVSNTRAINNTGTNKNSFGATYTVGPISSAVDYNQTTERVRASAKATVKGITVGAGVSRNELNVADSYVVGASYTMGAVTVGAAYSDGNGTAKEVGAEYALSKRTSVQLAVAQVNSNTTAANNTDTYRVRVSHSF
jgi:predicted porin